MFSALAYRIRRRQRLTWMEELSVEQWLSADQLQERSDVLTRNLIFHAATHVPYYRTVFRERGIDPNLLRIPEEWTQVPILDKDTLRHQYADLISQSSHSQNSYVNHTGGSTGVPVRFLTDNIQHARMGAWLDFVSTWAGWRPGELRLELWGNKEQQLPPTTWERIKASLSGAFAIPVYNYTEQEMFKWWQVLASLRPTVIYGYPSVLADFAAWLKSEHRQPPQIKGIFSSAEVLYIEQRALIENVFGCKVFNQYGSKETPCVACECPAGGMHIFVNWNRVEFVDSGQVREGRSEIVVTPLFNFAQPLLRYQIGDLGGLKSMPCSCGRGYPLMDLNIARSRDYLYSANGVRFYPGFFTRLMDGRSWVRAFQFVQRAESDLVLHVIPDTASDPERMRADLQQELIPVLREKMGQNLQFSVELVSGIDRTKAGKHRYVVNATRNADGV